ncbi:MAG: hypothetical protein K8R90_02270 [Candidatus Cloacimonetes bacterium]|nr:hypothetical protein [Candidatus Cloacimonadota bacterium]
MRPAINSHSIQKEKHLRLLSENGRVLCPMSDKIAEHYVKSGKYRPKNLGIKKATVFRGFCSYHDNDLFKLIEVDSLDYYDVDLHILFALRATAYHLAFKKLQLHQTVRNHGLLRSENLESLNRVFAELLDEISIYSNILNTLYVASTSKSGKPILVTNVLELNSQSPFATTSPLNLQFDHKDRRINCWETLHTPLHPLFVSVFPDSGRTYIMIQYFQSDFSKFCLFVEYLATLDHYYLGIQLSNLILSHSQNTF